MELSTALIRSTERATRATMNHTIESHLQRLRCTTDSLPSHQLARLGDMLYRAYDSEKQVFTLGNGGSASTASHIAADLAKNTIGANMRRFRIASLNENAAILTALANDLGYDSVFSEQLQNLIRPGDLLIAVSASGNSPNVIKAIRYAQSRSAATVGLLGFDGGMVARAVDLAIVVDSNDYGVVEDTHLIINHILVEYFRKRLAAEQPWVV